MRGPGLFLEAPRNGVGANSPVWSRQLPVRHREVPLPCQGGQTLPQEWEVGNVQNVQQSSQLNFFFLFFFLFTCVEIAQLFFWSFSYFKVELAFVKFSACFLLSQSHLSRCFCSRIFSTELPPPNEFHCAVFCPLESLLFIHPLLVQHLRGQVLLRLLMSRAGCPAVLRSCYNSLPINITI